MGDSKYEDLSLDSQEVTGANLQGQQQVSKRKAYSSRAGRLMASSPASAHAHAWKFANTHKT